MKYFLDTEFIERGPRFPIVPISVALVREDGASLYVVSNEFDLDDCSQWVRENVLPKLQLVSSEPMSVSEIANAVRLFIGLDPSPEFWADYCSYDWVVLCQLFGTMMDLPSGFPMYCNDIRQLIANDTGNKKLAKQDTATEHCALFDALHDKVLYESLTTGQSI